MSYCFAKIKNGTLKMKFELSMIKLKKVSDIKNIGSLKMMEKYF